METQDIQCVRLGGLTEEEGRELVSEYLEEFHKKLTVKQLELLIRFVLYIFSNLYCYLPLVIVLKKRWKFDDARALTSILSFLQKIVSFLSKAREFQTSHQLKDDSPLYLTAATEAIRRFGVWEEADTYIDELPDSVSALCVRLLDEWSTDYDDGFVRDVVCLILLSRGGLLENQVHIFDFTFILDKKNSGNI